MKMTGEQHIAASRQRVWEALNDPEVLRQSIPGCQSLDKEGDDRFTAVAEVKIGPIGARFKGDVSLSDLDAPNGYTITGKGNGGIAGSAKGAAKVRLSDAAGGGTTVSYDVDAEVGGRMAQLGGPIIDATAKQLAGKFFAKFGEVVSGQAAAGAAPAAAVVSPAGAPVASAAPVVVSGVAASPGGFPWAWAVAVAVAVFGGFLLGRSDAAEWWTVVMVVLAVVTAGAGYESGRRSGGRA
jgi:carbon monoxide dehydrogenase subunit G